MFSTTVLISVHIVYVKQLPWFVALAFFVVFGFFDGWFSPPNTICIHELICCM